MSFENCDDEEDWEDGECVEYEEYEETEDNTAIIGLSVGLVCILLGFVLSIIGITGFINWSFSFWGINSSITNAAPGVILMIIGLVIIMVTLRYKNTCTTQY
jgi:hypothetical protein